MTIPTTPWLETPAAFAAFVDAWIHCTLPKADWTHPAHVAIAAHCVTTDPWSALFRDYYSWDPLTSRSARATWFPPDRVGPLGPLL